MSALLLWGCASFNGRVITAETVCSELNGIKIPASAIGLPSRGATVMSTELVAANGVGPAAIGQYCKVMASIHPVEINAPNINFHLDLPTAWNSKATQNI
jgi:feruloyl esterase